tara:strand:+ start:40 stop:210 length:171 start_codon:yes stop_codon:yes gene_type:complete
MSTLHHESLYETCFEDAVEEFCISNKLTPEMYAKIEPIAIFSIEKKAQQLFDDKCY